MEDSRIIELKPLLRFNTANGIMCPSKIANIVFVRREDKWIYQ